MSDRLIIALLLSFSTLGAVISSSPLKDGWRSGKTDISLTIDNNEVTVTAIYPKAKAKNVHAYVQQALHLTDLPDLSRVAIEDYKTPDGLYSMDIKSRNGYLHIRMERDKNPPEIVEQAKQFTEGIRKALAN